jgi:hypothetical protein
MGLLFRAVFIGAGAAVLATASPGGDLMDKTQAVAQWGAGYVIEAAKAVDVQGLTKQAAAGVRDMRDDLAARSSR